MRPSRRRHDAQHDEQPALPVDGPVDPTVINSRTLALLMRSRGKQRYLVDKELAHGGMGVIYAVDDQDLQRTSAMKVIATNLVDDERRLKAFVEEARITAKLEHPNIIPVHEIGIRRDSGQPYYTMKLVEGEALSDIIFELSRRRPSYVRKYTRHALLDIFRKVCNAVAFAHSRGIIHRDIKPENIMVGDYGEVLVMDWGLAKYVEEPDSPSYLDAIGTTTHHRLERTQDGTIKGSLAYISPEQAFGELSEVDPQTDVFLLGATLYHMFTHYPPYEADNIQDILRKAETCDYQAPSVRNPEAQIPLALERIILSAMAPLKENRYQTVTELIEDLDAFIAGKRVCGRKIFSPGEDLIRIGDESRDTFIIISGKVDVYRFVDGHKNRIASLGKGEIVGEMAGITHKQRSATVTAVETTEALMISHELMLEELEKLPPWMEKIVFSMADRVQTLDTQIHPYLLANCAYTVLNQIYLIYGANAGSSRGLSRPTHNRGSLVREISINLGLDESRITAVLEALLRTNLIVLTPEETVYIPNLDVFERFVDYCRHRFDVKGGIHAMEEMKLSTEQDAYFRGIVRKLRELQ